MYDKLTLANMANGALQERFDHIIQTEIIPNLVDENIPSKAKRKIQITFELATNKDRSQVFYVADIKVVKASIDQLTGSLALSAVGEEMNLFQETSKQLTLPLNETAGLAIDDFREEKGAK
jgi:hypothetical protein